MRDQMLEVLRQPRAGTPLADRRWPARYAAHRIAWHALDHAWEIEDRSDVTDQQSREPLHGCVWFTDEAYDAEDDATSAQMLRDYAAHVRCNVEPDLPSAAPRVATDPDLHLHGAEFIEVALDPPSNRLEMVARLGNAPERSWLRLAFRRRRRRP